jgi:hypothetical protein
MIARRAAGLAAVSALAAYGCIWTGRGDGRTWYVDVDASPDGDGKSWQTAFKHPQDGVDIASAGEEVWVAEGTYVRREAADTAVLSLKEGIAIYGGFVGNEASREARDWEMHLTILDGERECRVVSGAARIVFDGFVVERGSVRRAGAGLATLADGILVSNCTFRDNRSYEYSVWTRGAVEIYSIGSSRISSCRFERNYSNGVAGGLYCGDGVQEVVVEDCRFLGNRARLDGGGFCGGTTTARGITMSRCSFERNVTVEGDGGGAYVIGEGSLQNCVFWGNSASVGGGLSIRAWSGAAAKVVNCAFSRNNAYTWAAGGAHCDSLQAGVLVNCIVWGNTSRATGPEEISDSGWLSVSHSNIRGGWPGDGNIDTDPMFVDIDAGVLALSAGSPCIDAANGDLAPDADIHGAPRVDDPVVANTGLGTIDCVDMGPYEASGPAVFLTSPNGDEPLIVGSVARARWASSDVDTVGLGLSRDGGVTWETIASDVPSSAGAYEWPVTDGGLALPQVCCVVRVSASGMAPSDVSERFFTIKTNRSWKVDIDALPGGDGLSWGTAFTHPQQAVDIASAGDEVWVADGTYSALGSSIPLLEMKDSVSVYGGFCGVEVSRSERQWLDNVTTLDGVGGRGSCTARPSASLTASQ